MDLVKQLRDTGIKITQHKLAILELFAEHKHLDAFKIAKTLQNKGIEISLATIYRILSSFEEHKIITKHNFGNEHANYELAVSNEHHDHLICLKCSKVIEFVSDEIEELQLQIAKQNNFEVKSHTLNLYGLCSECKLPAAN
jgi:Fur family ferric uptake transcriptional regulator